MPMNNLDIIYYGQNTHKSLSHKCDRLLWTMCSAYAKHITSLCDEGAIHHCAIALHHFGAADTSLFTNKDFYVIINLPNNFQKLFLHFQRTKNTERRSWCEKVNLYYSSHFYIGKRYLFELGIDLPFGFIEHFRGDFIGQWNTLPEIHTLLYRSWNYIPLGVGYDIGSEHQSIRKA